MAANRRVPGKVYVIFAGVVAVLFLLWYCILYALSPKSEDTDRLNRVAATIAEENASRIGALPTEPDATVLAATVDYRVTVYEVTGNETFTGIKIGVVPYGKDRVCFDLTFARPWRADAPHTVEKVPCGYLPDPTTPAT